MQRLLELAEQVARLPAYDHRNPHAFHEGKSEVAAALRKLARQLGPAREPRSGVEIRAIHASDNRPSWK